MKKMKKPPAIAQWLMSRVIKPDERFSVIGDLEEEYNEITGSQGVVKAQYWYWKHVLESLFPSLINSIYWSTDMFKNHFKIALRNMKRQKVFSFINISGLAIGMACVILIMLWVQDELSYDDFHENAENIYLVARGEGENFMAATSQMLAPALKSELPEVINAACYAQMPGNERFLIQYDDKSFEENACLVNSNFFEIFTFPFKRGNPAVSLAEPNSMVVTEATAQKYFGDEDALGKSVGMFLFGQKLSLKVTGVISNIPHNSHINTNVFISVDVLGVIGINWDHWDSQSPRTYIVVRDNCNIQELPQKIIACEKRNNRRARLSDLNYTLLPLRKIHLYGNSLEFLVTTGDIKYVIILTVIAVFILLIGIINYMNLSAALFLKRTREIGVKKVVGANRSVLALQLLGETLLLSVLALLSAVIIVRLFLPFFNQLSGKSLEIRYFETQTLLGLCLIALSTGLVSGIYPALFLSSFHPVNVIRGILNFNVKSENFRKGLVLFQFSLSIILIIGTIVVYKQLIFIRNSNVGYDKDNIVCLRMKGDANSNYNVLRNEILLNPDILSVSRSEPIEMNKMTRTTSIGWRGKRVNEEKHVWVFGTDYDFASTYNIHIIEGRYFSREFSSDKTAAYVINEKAAEMMGFKSSENAQGGLWGRRGKVTGEELNLWGNKGEIIGVVKDFHFSSFHRAIEPLIIRIPDERRQNLFFRLLSIRFKPGTLHESLMYIEKKWNELNSGIPFDYHFINEALDAQYRADRRMGTISRYFSILAVFIACLGLFGLTSFSLEQKTKEIGIRKIVGASVSNITVLLSKEFLRWVLIANVIAWPIAYFAMNSWLQSFAYKTGLSWWIFIVSGVSAFIIALLTVVFQVMKSANTNPVETLRYE